jgi:HEAT repeat protein
MFDAAAYEMIELNSAVALCRLGDTARLEEILALLESPDENFRGFIAEALGGIGHPDVVAALEGVIAKETFGWVKAAAEESLGGMR